MANTSTLIDTIPVEKNGTNFANVYTYNVVFDTADSDLIIHATTTGKRAALIGLFYAETSAHVLTIKSDSTTLVALEMSGSPSGIIKEIQNRFGILAMSKLSEDIVLRCGTAVVSSMLVTIAEFESLTQILT